MDIRCSFLIFRILCIVHMVQGSVTPTSIASTTHSRTIPGQGARTLPPPGIKTRSPTVAPPTVCATTTRWSSWINRDKPETGTGDKEDMAAEEKMKFCPIGTIVTVECQRIDGTPYHDTMDIVDDDIVMTDEEKMKFCPTGTIVTVECQRSDGTPYYDSMDIVDCNPVTGTTCDNDVNMGQCGDYMVRYKCEHTTCGGCPTNASLHDLIWAVFNEYPFIRGSQRDELVLRRRWSGIPVVYVFHHNIYEPLCAMGEDYIELILIH